SPVIMNSVAFTVRKFTTFVSISNEAALVQSKDGDLFNRLPVTLEGKEEYNIDDILKAAHEQYADVGHGYSSANGDWGLSIIKLWGDESGAFGYWQNDNSAWSLGDKVADGDFVSAFVYKDQIGWSDAYTKFAEPLVTAPAKSRITLTLQKYDWSDGFVPCVGAEVSVMGLPNVGGTTDENGTVTLVIPTEGTYTAIAQSADIPIVPASCTITLSAPIDVTGITASESVNVWENGTAEIEYEILPSNASDKSVIWEVEDETVATVSDGVVTGVKEGSTTVTVKTNDGEYTATCTVTVNKAPEAASVIHAIAARYAQSGIASDANAPWFAADFSAYGTLYPNSENKLSDAQIQEYLDKLIDTADTAESPADFAKCIIALRALGYNPEDIVTSDYRQINVVDKLDALIAGEDSRVTYIYTLPYIIIAVKDYADNETLNSLISSALEQKDDWQSTAWGVDGATPMVCALAPFYSTNDNVKSIIDETVEIIKNEQAENGSIGNAASSGLALAALSSVGIDGEDVKNGEKSLIDGLMAQVSDTKNGFLPLSNSISTEQGFRGLLAWQLLEQKKGTIFDFSANENKTAYATWGNYCPVTFNVVPDDATVAVKGQDSVYQNLYDLQQGEYSYTVSKEGYVTANGTFTVDEQEENTHTPKAVNVSLVSEPSSGSNKLNVSIKILTHDADKCNNSVTYKANASAYTPLASGTVSVSSGQTVFDALHLFLSEENISYKEKTYGYISSIDGLDEFDHGQNSGWLFMVDGKTSQTGCRNVKLTSNSSIVWFYTDDYTEEAGSEPWKKSSSKSTVTLVNNNPSDDKNNDTEQSVQSVFSDVKETDWFYEAVKYALEKKLMQGTDKGFEPNGKMTRAMLVTVLYRLENTKASSVTGKFADVAEGEWYSDAVSWASANGVAEGLDSTHFAPDESISREQLAVIMYRYAKFKKYNTEASVELSQFTDADQVSDWAVEAIAWANAVQLIKGTSDKTISPKDTATRAQIAEILMRFCKNVVK
ncbi:MAG: S-layer homology domain-containing protein, partial [Clostridia bacterium]|nr:S-layer homology domain-containing protein [Clostridia bacterium]